MTIKEIAEVSRAVADLSTTPITAEQEYIKNPDLKKDDIKKLREWVHSQPHLPLPTEEELIRFHHSCYYNFENTKKCMEMYYKLRQNTPEFFNQRQLSRPEVKQGLEALYYSSVPVKDPNGYQIIFHSLHLYEPSKYSFNDGVKLLLMAIDACLHVEGTTPGYIFLFDMKGVKLTHLTRLSFTFLRKFFQYIQEGNPIRLKAIHVVNTLPIIDKVMFMIKPFMNKDLIDLIHFHSSDLSEIQQHLPKNCLPKDFGGDLQSCSELHGCSYSEEKLFNYYLVRYPRDSAMEVVQDKELYHFFTKCWRNAKRKSDIAEKYCDWVKRLQPYFDDEEERRTNDKCKNKKENTEHLNLRNLTLD